jgi:DNA-binding NtrC family response regulator
MGKALLVSQSDALIAEIKKIGERLPDLTLTISRTLIEAHQRLQNENVLVVLLDATGAMSDAEILEFLHSVAQSKWTGSSLILADSHRDDQAPALLRAGVADFLDITFDLGRLRFLLETLTLQPCLEPLFPESTPLARPNPFLYVVASPVAEMMEQIRRLAAQDTTLLITGETGTGKTRLARFIHDLSPRYDPPFIVVDCAALSSNLIESEFFGHIRGAFTGADRDRTGKFATAAGGTIVLDEINALPYALQCKLLRVVDERVFEPVGSNQAVPLKARLMAVSSAPLDQEVKAGRFRSDLFYRLNVVEFYLPPLRDRQSAIAPLCHRFLAEFASRNRPDITGLAPGVLQVLEEYGWPGNVRELRNAMERAVALAKGPLVTLHDFPHLIYSQGRETKRSLPEPELIKKPLSGGILSRAQDEIELRQTHAALKKHRNNRLHAAAELGISRMGLYKKLHKYGLISTGKSI